MVATKPKDQNAPKHPLSSYMLYTQEERPKLAAQNPDMKVTDVSKLIGEAWSKLEASDKKRFEDEAAKLKAAYEEELEKYKKSKEYQKYQDELKKWEEEQKITAIARSPKKSDAPGPAARSSKSKSPRKSGSPRKSASPRKSGSARKSPKAAKSPRVSTSKSPRAAPKSPKKAGSKSPRTSLQKSKSPRSSK